MYQYIIYLYVAFVIFFFDISTIESMCDFSTQAFLAH